MICQYCLWTVVHTEITRKVESDEYALNICFIYLKIKYEFYWDVGIFLIMELNLVCHKSSKQTIFYLWRMPLCSTVSQTYRLAKMTTPLIFTVALRKLINKLLYL